MIPAMSLTFYLFYMVLFVGLLAAGVFFYLSREDDRDE